MTKERELIKRSKAIEIVTERQTELLEDLKLNLSGINTVQEIKEVFSLLNELEIIKTRLLTYG
jgi:hypothetical protein